MKTKKNYYLLTMFSLMCGLSLQATQTAVTTTDFSTAYAAAADGDTLLLSDGTYSTSFEFPNVKTITLKAADGASPVFASTISGSTNDTGGGLIFDGVNIDLNGTSQNYLINTSIGNIKIFAFRNLTIANIGRCILRTGTEGYSIDEIEISNCIIKDCGTSGYSFIYPKHSVKKVTIKNSTLYNYTGGESLFYPNYTDATNVLEFVFENNTVYKWAKSSDRALANVRGCYSSSSTYTFTNNIISTPGVSGTTPMIVNLTGGDGVVTANKNLVVDYGTYTGGTQTINDVTLSSLGLSLIGFTDPDNGDFTIDASSPIATAGVDGAKLGDPRWITISSGIQEKELSNDNTSVYYDNTSKNICVSTSRSISNLSLISLSGTLVKEWKGNGQIYSATSLNSGLYLAKVVFDDQTSTVKKIVVN